MRLTHVTVKNWRNFKQADFDLPDRMLVIGPNASGKSNLLDALRFLGQVASPGGGFQNAVASRGGMARLRCLAARYFNKGRVTLRITIGDDERPCRWAYEITFTAEQRGKRRPMLYQEVVESDARKILTRPTREDDEDRERMTQTYLEQVNANREFRPIVEYLRSIRYLHLVPHLIRDPERAGDRAEDPYGADFLLRIADTPEKPAAGACNGSTRPSESPCPNSTSSRSRRTNSAAGIWKPATGIGGLSRPCRTSGTSPTEPCG